MKLSQTWLAVANDVMLLFDYSVWHSYTMYKMLFECHNTCNQKYCISDTKVVYPNLYRRITTIICIQYMYKYKRNRMLCNPGV
jgi:hypothetical protein